MRLRVVVLVAFLAMLSIADDAVMSRGDVAAAPAVAAAPHARRSPRSPSSALSTHRPAPTPSVLRI